MVLRPRGHDYMMSLESLTYVVVYVIMTRCLYGQKTVAYVMVLLFSPSSCYYCYCYVHA